MLKKTAIALAILFLAVAFSVENQTTHFTQATNPTKLYLITGSPGVLSDNSTLQCIFVQLQDSTGKPARALQDITIGLSSSLTTVGTVDSTITIHKGETFAQANFTSTFYPGTTTISASATGFPTVLSTLTTVGPIPSAIAVYGFPATLPSDGNTYPAIMVQLQDSTGSPARAPQAGVQIALTSSDTTVGTVTPSITIPEGETYAIANFNTTTTAQTEAKIKSANITAVSQGYSSNQITITTTPIASNATKLKIFTGPPKVLADQSSYRQIAVQLQNATGFAAKKPSEDTTINVASSDSSICQIDSMKISAGQNYELATLNTTYKAGTANITAVANNFPSTAQTINTIGFIASKLAIYSLPTSLPSDGKTYQTIQVQLQDGQGRPAKNTAAEANIKLFSSQPTVGAVSPMLTIPLGKSTASGNLTLTFTPGNTTITAQASGYTTGQTTIAAYLIDSYPISATTGPNGTISPNGTINAMLGSNQQFNITASTGYHIANITIDDVPQESTNSYTFQNITQPHTILANFAINTFNLNITQTPNGEISPETNQINYADTPTFSITPNEGYYITNITANGKPILVVSSSGQNYQFAPVTTNVSLTATFTIKKFTIQVTEPTNGTITPGTTTINYNESQRFTITPDIGCHIVDVIVNGKSVGPVSSYLAQNVKSAITIAATFAENPAPTLTPTPAPSPNPTLNPESQKSTINATTQSGAKVSLTISGNITSQQITNITITPNTSTKTTTISFTVSGEKDDIGSCIVTIPKSVVEFGTSAKTYIDGANATRQGYSQDNKNHYVWFATHFSSHKVSIIFSIPISISGFLPQESIYALSAMTTALIIFSGLIIYKKRYEIKDKLENIHIF